MMIKHKPNKQQTQTPLSVYLKVYLPHGCVTVFRLIKGMIKQFKHLFAHC